MPSDVTSHVIVAEVMRLGIEREGLVEAACAPSHPCLVETRAAV
jgi:hypothetical protein